MEKKAPLKDEELGQVTGGLTDMHCNACGWGCTWSGCFQNGTAYKCPNCGANAFYGVKEFAAPEIAIR